MIEPEIEVYIPTSTSTEPDINAVLLVLFIHFTWFLLMCTFPPNIRKRFNPDIQNYWLTRSSYGRFFCWSVNEKITQYVLSEVYKKMCFSIGERFDVLAVVVDEGLDVLGQGLVGQLLLLRGLDGGGGVGMGLGRVGPG